MFKQKLFRRSQILFIIYIDFYVKLYENYYIET